jgi:hypothetical protein
MEEVEWHQSLSFVISGRKYQVLSSLNHWNLDWAKALDPEWHEVMVNPNLEIFEMSYEKSVSYFKRLKNLEKIRHTNGPGVRLYYQQIMKYVNLLPVV